MSETGCEVGVPRRRHLKKIASSPCQYLGTVGCLLQICSQGLQDDMADGFLPRQSGTDCTQPISGLIGLPGGLPRLPFTIRSHLRWCRQDVHCNLNMWRNVMFSDESRFCLRQLDCRVKVWRRTKPKAVLTWSFKTKQNSSRRNIKH
ncbi:hypothetical protein MHYP_G00085360 [Metynnis hypsauchen]